MAKRVKITSKMPPLIRHVGPAEPLVDVKLVLAVLLDRRGFKDDE